MKRLTRAAALVAALLFWSAPRAALAADQVYFSAVDDVAAQLVQRINAETVRIDMSAWYLTDSTVYNALLNRFKAGVPVRLIGDRGSIFEIDPNTRNTFYYLASQGVPIRLRYNPTWYPEIDHWKATIFVGQNLVAFGSANYTPFELTPVSSTNYKDEVTLFTTDPALVGAFKTKFDTFWHDTAPEPESLIPSAPYFKDWDDACALEPACSDYSTQYPNPAPMVINTARLEPDNPLPPEMVWGQGPSFNNRLTTEIDNEQTAVDLVIYRLTVDNITNALLAKHAAGVPIRLIIEPQEYLNRKWPEFWITHANLDTLWAAGVPMKMRAHAGLTHMKVLVTSSVATIASSNYAASWQRDHNYFIPASAKPTIYGAIKNRFQTMWNDTTGFAVFQPQGPDAPVLASPASGAGSVSTTPTLTWNGAVFATNYDVYVGTSSTSMTLVGNVPAQLVNSPPPTYSFTLSNALAGNTKYYWKVVSRTNATPRNPNLVASSSVQSFTTGAATGGGGGGSLPSPWLTQDIGAVGATGSASYSNGVFTVAGSGADIWGTADAFRYVYQPVSGDAQIVTRVASVQNTNLYAKAGVMLRESLAAGAAHVVLDVRPDGNIEFMARTATNGATSYLAGASDVPPTWLKLARTGNTVTGYVSSNGSTWTTVGSTTTSMSSSATMGFLVNSHSAGVLNTSTFDNVALAAGSTPPPPPPPTGLPSPWTNQDIGSTGLAGSASYTNGTFTVAGAGGDIWGSSDAFQYVSQTTSGDVQIVARVTAIQNTQQWAKAGVMLRQALTASSPHVLLDVTPGGTIEFMTRTASGATTTLIKYGSQAVPAWLKLARTGSTVTASISSNGSTWTTLGSTTTSIPSSAYVGLAVTSHDVNTLNTSSFDNVSVTTPSAPPPPPPPTATDVVIYASAIPAAALHGSWSSASDPTSPSSVKLVTPDNGVANPNNPLASPVDYVDVTFSADANTPYTLWLRLQATANSKYNDAVWVQFSDALAGGSPVFPLNSTSGLLVNLATDSSGSSLNKWGWQNGAYWLSQPVTFTFANTGTHTMRIQVREDGVQFDQIVLSPGTYLNQAPGSVTNDSTIVPIP